MPYGSGRLEISFDFIDHMLVIETSEGGTRELPLKPQSVADFYQTLWSPAELGMPVSIWTMPCELPENTIPFEKDAAKSYDAEPHTSSGACWSGLTGVQRISRRVHRQSSPGSFFLGKFRSGGYAFFRPALPGAAGCRPDHARSVFPRGQQRRILAGRRRYQGPCLLFVRFPEPQGFAEQGESGRRLLSSGDEGILLMYDDVRKAESPKAALMDVSADHLRSSGRSWATGIARALER